MNEVISAEDFELDAQTFLARCIPITEISTIAKTMTQTSVYSVLCHYLSRLQTNGHRVSSIGKSVTSRAAIPRWHGSNTVSPWHGSNTVSPKLKHCHTGFYSEYNNCLFL
ncbi:hypothetical protein HELRODRAFT_159442 [Helobdella robusta]|uniref:Uncharacterized protein n=1 Tax=Helobdella robusta TaxID=6412 RepID=T1EP14_HELRO|nr:hypothetical protein HELRODRAFT_159442 [Helobdella robusta]ESO12855.1 hypothetical protein HELRODRAFT_159442 [Helobdella robusta]